MDDLAEAGGGTFTIVVTGGVDPVVVTVTARSPLLPGITIAAEAVAAAEPGQR